MTHITPTHPPTHPSTHTFPLLQAAALTWRQLDHDLDTNGILYLDLALDFDGLPPRLLPLVPLFCS